MFIDIINIYIYIYIYIYICIYIYIYTYISVSEGIDVNQTNESKECDICHYWYFLDKSFREKL